MHERNAAVDTTKTFPEYVTEYMAQVAQQFAESSDFTSRTELERHAGQFIAEELEMIHAAIRQAVADAIGILDVSA